MHMLQVQRRQIEIDRPNEVPSANKVDFLHAKQVQRKNLSYINFEIKAEILTD